VKGRDLVFSLASVIAQGIERFLARGRASCGVLCARLWERIVSRTKGRLLL